jgi:Flp pilus assembly protein TadD
MVHLTESVEKNPEITAKYGEKIRQLAKELTMLCIWQPVTVMLEQGAIQDPDNAPEYFKSLSKAYICQRRWKEALEQFENYAEKMDTNWIYEDVGHAYLGLGETPKALTAYKAAVSEAGRGLWR